MADLRTTGDFERAAAKHLIHVPTLLREEFGISSSEGRRLIVGGAVRLDGEVLSVDHLDLPASKLAYKTLTVGKRRSVEL